MKRKVISTVIAACMVVGTMASFGTSVNAATSKSEDSGEKVTLKLFHNWILKTLLKSLSQHIQMWTLLLRMLEIRIISLNLRLCLVQIMLLIFSFHGAVNLRISLQEREVRWI